MSSQAHLLPVTARHRPGIVITRFKVRITPAHVRHFFEDYVALGGGPVWLFDCTAVAGLGDGVHDESMLNFEQGPKYGLRYVIVVTSDDAIRMSASSVRDTVQTMSGVEIRLVQDLEKGLGLAEKLAQGAASRTT